MVLTLYIIFLWLIYYKTGDLYLLILFIYFVFSSPLAAICLFLYLWDCFHIVYFIFYISYVKSYGICLSLTDISLSIIPSRFIHVVKNGKNPFFYGWVASYYRRSQWHPTPVLLPGKSHGREEPGGLQSMGSLRVGHSWATSLSLFIFMHWRRKWQPTPVFLPGESRGREPHGLLSMRSHRVGHDWSDLAAASYYMYILCIPHFLYPLIYWWTLRLLQYLVYVNNVAMNIDIHISFRISVFIFFG